MKKQQGFSILEIMIVAGLMSVIGLSMSSIFTNSNKSQKRIEQKEVQAGVASYLSSVLQNKNFCANVFCTSAATCAAKDLTGLPVAAGTTSAIILRGLQAFGGGVGSAQNILSCNLTDKCFDTALFSTASLPTRPNVPPWGTPVSGVSGLFVYATYLKNITWQLFDTGTGFHVSTASLVIQYASDPKKITGGNFSDTVINLTISADATGRIQECSSGGAATLWQLSPTTPPDIYYSLGNVGIGTTTPVSPLTLASSATTSTTIGSKENRIFLLNPSVTVNNGAEIVVGTADTGVGRYAAIGTAIQTNAAGDAFGDVYIATKTSASLGVTSLTPNIYVKGENGNVGVGIAVPTSKLHIVGGGTSADWTLSSNDRIKFRGDGVVTWGAAADAGLLSWTGGNAIVGGMVGANLSLHTNGTEKMLIETTGNVGIGTATPGAKVDIVGNLLLSGASRTIGVDANTNLTMSTSGTGALNFNTGGAVRLNITSAGTSTFANQIVVTSGGANITGDLVSSGLLTVGTGANITGDINHLGTGNLVGSGGTVSNYASYSTTSDQTLKENIVELNSQTDFIKKIVTYSYNYIDDPQGKKHFGVMAQEIREIYPNLVSESKNGKLNVNYQELIPILIKGLQESNRRISNLEFKNRQLEKQIQSMNKRR